MNAPKSTPGPWLLYGDTMRDVLVEHGNADEIGDDAYKILATTRVHGGHHFRCVGADEQRANGRLIAAAPELYQSLLEMVEDSDDVDDGKLPKISAATLTRARQALAKAVAP